jgi:hypothetical protein
MSEPAIPEELLQKVRTKASRHEGTRFPHKIFSLLSWAGTDSERMDTAGCGWVSDSEFFIQKPVLSQVLHIRPNTLNTDLTNLGFQATRQSNGVTFWKRDGFLRNSPPEALDAIRKAPEHPERRPADPRALYFAVMDPLQLWGLSPDDDVRFRRAVIADWDRLIGGGVLFGAAAAGIREQIARDAESSNSAWLLAEAFAGVCDFFAFAVVLARFGPYDSLLVKIAQYRAIVAQDAGSYTAPPFAQHFSPTFHNCFSLALTPEGEFHCYNLPCIDDGAPFLADEDGHTYASWADVIEENKTVLGRYRSIS